jgi:hypothetical protein
MKRFIILIICAITIICTFESCKRRNPKAEKAIISWIISIFKKGKPTVDIFQEMRRIRKGDFEKSSEVLKYFKYNDNISGTITFQDFTKNEVKAIVKTLSINNEIKRKVSIENLLFKTFRELNYAKVDYNDLNNGFIEVIVPYHSRKSYLKLLVRKFYAPQIKSLINRLSLNKYDDPYSEFKKLDIPVENMKIVQYIESGIIVENILKIYNDARFSFSPNAV